MRSTLRRVTLPFFHKGELFYIDEKVEEIDLANIAESVSLPFSPSLESSVLRELKNPVVVIPNSLENHSKAMLGLADPSKGFEYRETLRYLCIYGNQRLAIARKHKHSSISCACLSTIDEAIVVGNSLETNIL